MLLEYYKQNKFHDICKESMENAPLLPLKSIQMKAEDNSKSHAKWYTSEPIGNSAPQSKNAVSTNIKHTCSRYIHLISNFSSIHFHTKRLYVHMFGIIDTSFSYVRGLIVCSSLQEFSKTKRKNSACDPKCRYCVFTLWGRISMLSGRLGNGV